MAGLVKDSFSVSLHGNISIISWYIIPDLLNGRYLQTKTKEKQKIIEVEQKKKEDVQILVIPGRVKKPDYSRIEVPQYIPPFIIPPHIIDPSKRPGYSLNS
jgi:hypothetical protein